MKREGDEKNPKTTTQCTRKRRKNAREHWKYAKRFSRKKMLSTKRTIYTAEIRRENIRRELKVQHQSLRFCLACGLFASLFLLIVSFPLFGL
jgi:hypothetical protein